jgi:hypothetical protein
LDIVRREVIAGSPILARAPRKSNGTMRRVFSEATRHIGTPSTIDEVIQWVSAPKG